MAEKKKMTVAEILAAARATGGQDSAAKPAAPKEPEAVAEQSAVEVSAKPVPKPKPVAASPVAGGARPGVADILAMARAKKAEAAATTTDAVAEKPASAAAKPVASKPAAKPAAAVGAAKTGVQRDTASILAAARAAAKPGPVAKADAPSRPALKPRETAKPIEEKAAPPRTVATLPAKPVKPTKKGAADGEDRRGFLQIAVGSAMAMGFTALSVTGGLFTLGLTRFLFPNVLAEPPSKFKVGSKDGFPAGKVETKFVAQYGVWVVNGDFQGLQQVYALKTVCTHLGCTPSWLEAEQKFKCPCHGSGFYKDGVNFEGPAPRPLERYAIRVADDGQLEIDKSKSFQEELGQWADPDSFVTV
ncbi:MAG: Rieske 2Fe-2S domain-containing protein [Pirellulales bacterium]